MNYFIILTDLLPVGRSLELVVQGTTNLRFNINIVYRILLPYGSVVVSAYSNPVQSYCVWRRR